MRTPRAMNVLAVAVLALGLIAIPAPPVVSAREARPTAADRGLIARLEQGTDVSWHRETGRVRHLGGTDRRPVAFARSLGRPATPRAAARAFLDRYGSLFGVRNATRDLQVTRVQRSATDHTIVRVEQRSRGVPVMGGEIRIQVSAQGDIISARGETSPGLDRPVRTRVPAAEARDLALRETRRLTGVAAARLHAGRPVTRVFDSRVMGGPHLPVARLVWLVPVVGARVGVDREVLVDALTGQLVASLDRAPQATIRVCDQEGDVTGQGSHGDRYPCDPGEGVTDPASSLRPEVRNTALALQGALTFLADHFGRDGIRGDGAPVVATVRHCPTADQCPYENATWSKLRGQMAIGQGFAVDDVVGHELVHGITAAESGLYYYFQSGALDESIADVFGEAIDQVTPMGLDSGAARWLIGEDLPGGAVRSMADPPEYSQPDRMGNTLYTVASPGFDHGGVHINSGVGNKAAWLTAQGGRFNGHDVSGLGRAKMLAIWWAASVDHLGSASDYGDLADALTQACTDLTGTVPKDVGGEPAKSGAITKVDCATVAAVIAATEMRKPARAEVADPALCHGSTPQNILLETFQENEDDWTTAASSLAWQLRSVYATSPPWHMHVYSPSERLDLRLTQNDLFSIPTDRPVFLAFRQARDLGRYIGSRHPVDAAVMEGSRTPPFAEWVDLGAFMMDNGYDGVVSGVLGNALAGRRTFSQHTRGYVLTKLNLTPWAGWQSRVRFRLVTDDSGGAQGWFLDDLRVYTCRDNGDATPPQGPGPSYDLTVGSMGPLSSPVVVRVRMNAKDPSGIAETRYETKRGSDPFTTLLRPRFDAPYLDIVAPSSTAPQTFRTRAVDEQGNLSGWKTSSAIFRLFEESSSRITYTGPWGRSSGDTFSGRAARHTSTAGRRASIRVTDATDVAWVATKGPDRGQAEIWVDGVRKATVDLYESQRQDRQVVYAASFASGRATHTFEVRVLSTRHPSSSGNRVDIDAFEAIVAP